MKKDEGFGWGFALPVSAAAAPRQRQAIPEKLRADCWNLHLGVNTKQSVCLFCCTNPLSYVDKYGWAAAHIVPDKFFTNQPLNVYNLVPICAACNGSMGTDNALDFLYNNNKITSLKTICTNIYTAFAARNEEHMGDAFEHSIWKLMAKLFGSDEHMAGGGITCANEGSIYNILMLHQMDALQGEIAALLAAVKGKSAQMEALIRDKFRPSKRARLFA